MVLDSGVPGGSALGRFGRNPTIEAQAIVDELPAGLVGVETQQESGVAPFLSYEQDDAELRIGTTPLGFPEKDITAKARGEMRLSNETLLGIEVEREAVTDSIVSFAGTRDPVTGAYWGQVMRLRAGIDFSYDERGDGFYGTLAVARYDGHNVPDNRSYEANLGGYLLLSETARSRLTLGSNINYQRYDNNQNFFTFGQGGYFSPQGFLSIGFPIRYTYRDDRLDLTATATPGYQSFNQDAVPVYPTDRGAQAELDALRVLNPDVRAYFDRLSKTGGAFSAGVTGSYAVSAGTRITGDVLYDSFGNYNEFRSLIGLRQQIGSGN